MKGILRLMPIIISVAGALEGMKKFKALPTVEESMSAQAEVQVLADMMRGYISAGNKPPVTQADFTALLKANRAYLKQNMKLADNRDASLDMWGVPFIYIPESNQIKIISFGPDKSSDTEDDVAAQVLIGEVIDRK